MPKQWKPAKVVTVKPPKRIVFTFADSRQVVIVD
jgi:uncharacterized protein YndB with AHSA1/START domain